MAENLITPVVDWESTDVPEAKDFNRIEGNISFLAQKKEPVFNKNTAFNKDYNELPGNVKQAGNASVGTQDLVARADHIHPLNIDETAPSTQAMGDSAFVGTATTYARRDHKHAMPTFGTATNKDSSSGGGSAAEHTRKHTRKHIRKLTKTIDFRIIRSEVKDGIYSSV